ncbi:acyltransferase [Butyrivibrio sp. MB2005]|uniref:acyltransferase n=1 Tax=Butyrivibrio sp. MB2005 TaxID=1280678 RepID=UPI00041F3B14|nr:acyltransferase [Butyrivibrio sp. MB2005]
MKSIIKKIYMAITKLWGVSPIKFIWWNFCSRRITRLGKHYIYPYFGTHITVDKSAHIELNGDLFLNAYKIRGSKQECLVVLRKGAKWVINGETYLYYGAGVQVHNNAELTTGRLYMNTGSIIICGLKINLGDVVSMARMSSILDDDHHPIYNSEGKIINSAKEIVIGNNVLIGMKASILKGATIGDQCVIGANSLVGNIIPSNTMVGQTGVRPIAKDITWER